MGRRRILLPVTGIRVFWPAVFMGKITCYEVVLPCGEPGQASVGDVKGKEYYRFYAGKLSFLTIP